MPTKSAINIWILWIYVWNGQRTDDSKRNFCLPNRTKRNVNVLLNHTTHMCAKLRTLIMSYYFRILTFWRGWNAKTISEFEKNRKKKRVENLSHLFLEFKARARNIFFSSFRNRISLFAFISEIHLSWLFFFFLFHSNFVWTILSYWWLMVIHVWISEENSPIFNCFVKKSKFQSKIKKKKLFQSEWI